MVQLNLNLTIHTCCNYTIRHVFNTARICVHACPQQINDVLYFMKCMCAHTMHVVFIIACWGLGDI